MPRKKGSPVKNTSFRLTDAELLELAEAAQLLGVKSRTDAIRLMIRNVIRGAPGQGQEQLRQLVREVVRAEAPEIVRAYLLENLAPGGRQKPGLSRTAGRLACSAFPVGNFCALVVGSPRRPFSGCAL